MRGLGYEPFGGQGGDWGSKVATYLGYRHPKHVAAIHLNMVVGSPEAQHRLDRAGVTPEEVGYMMAVHEFLSEETGYQRIQGTKLQTLAYALNDSFAGLSLCLVEMFRIWSDCDGVVEW